VTRDPVVIVGVGLVALFLGVLFPRAIQMRADIAEIEAAPVGYALEDLKRAGYLPDHVEDLRP
jgi:hypothetical protein